ncbi:hypothetical protein GCM10010466_58580 [Planomonospora alba]|uniref:Sulfatase-modifying factor enzyme domain-containing protein n=1 Tax=Planomonospora alba TaxID=161354 RepID=A0ABP6NWJ0_9ACTN
MPAVLAERGTRPPTPDEWEYPCGAGSPHLFRWGDGCPGGGPLARSGPHRLPNLFGLRIAQDPYRVEMTSDERAACGGDGGEAVCGGYGGFLEWLPLATAYRHPDTAEMLYGEDHADYFDELLVRPVIDLR